MIHIQDFIATATTFFSLNVNSLLKNDKLNDKIL